ncbi:MAG: CPBP family intramembrane metalloprotease [Candidatus Mcinerneyibacterium aminivorans]|jgi:hypothetical protein|uniref:CPBP family intramembrane metalloprotease n=1 Tax=Candidatus Mcinerneyibacterium aminivorans TaxID=2703815 RepID=A0A5D0MCY4_9BACT|nr:MAG: CPBP family intramembrane metalloprotease [Candidatus Mcinerneyibacterium aminivorans]
MFEKIKGWQSSLYYLLVYIFIGGTLTFFVGSFILKLAGLNDFILARYYIIKSFDLIFVLILTFLFAGYVSKEKFSDLGLCRDSAIKNSFLGVLGGFIFIFIVFIFFWGFNYLAVQEVSLNIKGLFFAFIFWMYVAIIEELVYRGYILNNLSKSFNKYISIVIVSILFSLVHASNPNTTILGFINLFLFGFLVGLYYINKKSLWFPIFFHFSWNFFQGSFFGMNISGLMGFSSIIEINMISKNKFLTGSKFGAEGSILVTVLLITFIIVMKTIFKKEK